MSQRRNRKQASGDSGLPEGHRGPIPCPPRRDHPWLKTATAVLIAALTSLLAVSTFFKLAAPPQQPQHLTAAIVDQLSLTQPDPDFVRAATDTLQRAGYAVDYYPGDQVTVGFYRNLPLHDYGLVILRVHSGIAEDTGSPSLFTSEAYSQTRYVSEQRAGRFGRARYYDGGDVYFGLYPGFVQSSMHGTFDKAVIVMMGCWGLRRPDLAEAFVQRGARAVVSWDGLVSAAQTDAATERLLHHLLVDKVAVGEAVAQTMMEVGPDPASESSLLFYPPESAGSRLAGAYAAP